MSTRIPTARHRRPVKLVFARNRTTTAARYLIPTPTPLRAVITVIDSARTSGVATYVHGRLWHYTEVDARDPNARRIVIRDAVTASHVHGGGVPHALAIEVPYGGYQRTAISLAETAALWRDTWRAAGQPMAHVLERTASDWRLMLFGRRDLPRAQARMYEGFFARRIVERDRPPCGVMVPGPDAAAAICIGQVFVRSRELRAVLGCECI